mmetsp:Transcript_3116/g.7658  ORF Transcript_3116/g.7658 Transcript_3116/m.7658 type:complete len:603 (-) Transcript_3116:6-1814(-)
MLLLLCLAYAPGSRVGGAHAQCSRVGGARVSHAVASIADRLPVVAADALAEHREGARAMWQAIALAKPVERDEHWDLRSRARLLDSKGAAAKLEELAKLSGTYYANGLASCQVGEELVHPFEAWGFAKALSFNGDGSAYFRTRVIDTQCSVREREDGVVRHRGTMSKGLGSPMSNILAPQQRDTANIALRSWPLKLGGSHVETPVLIAGGDNGSPHGLDPRSLETLGELAENVASLSALKGKRLLAHTRFDAARGRLVFAASDIKVKPGAGGRSVLEFWEVDLSGDIVNHVRHETDFMIMHDWMITEHYYVVPKTPATLSWGGIAKFVLGIGRGVGAFELDYETAGALLLIPREKGAPVLTAKDADFWTIFHFGPTYERVAAGGAREVVVNAITFDNYRFGGEMGFDAERGEFDPIGWSGGPDVSKPVLAQFVVDVASSTLRRERLPVLCAREDGSVVDVPLDMPTIHPLCDGLESRYCYAAGAVRPEGWFPFNSVVKIDLQTRPVGVQAWFAPEHAMVSEPMLLPRGRGGEEDLGAAAEDEGFVVSIVHDAAKSRCEMYVWDARTFDEGPFCAIDLGALYPWDVHATWSPGLYIDDKRSAA